MIDQTLARREALAPEPISDLADVAQPTKGLIALAVAGIALLYLLGIEQGSVFMGLADSNLVHEFLHDARHIAAFPCH